MIESASGKVPVDICSISVENVINVEHLQSWPVSTDQYTFLADDVCLALSSIESQLTGTNVEYADAFSLVQADLLGELFRLVVVGFEAECIMQNFNQPVFGPATSPILSQFSVMESFDQLDGEILKKLSVQVNRSFRRTVKRALLRIRALSRFVGRETRPVDRISTNSLLDESGAIALSRPVWIDALLTRSRFDPSERRDIDVIGATISDRILKSDLLESSLRPVLKYLLGQALRQVVCTYLKTAYSDLVKARTVPGRLLGESLVSGSPKYAGRLLGMIYQQHGKPVIRFEHGGERPFFFDPGWPLSELRFCDEYRCFGWAGAKALTDLYGSNAVNSNGPQTPIFLAQGSIRHQDIFRDSIASNPSVSRRKTILYVPGLYLGEIYRTVSVRFKLNDIVYLNWQIWLISELKKLGYHVIVKAHPGGLSFVGRLLESYADEFWTARYDPQAARVYVNLFDFPGTAMMDALATTAPIVLIDSGMRQINQFSFSDLLDRVSVVSGHMAPNNLFRVSSGELSTAMEEAIQKVEGSFDFVSKYFYQKPESGLG